METLHTEEEHEKRLNCLCRVCAKQRLTYKEKSEKRYSSEAFSCGNYGELLKVFGLNVSEDKKGK